MSNRDQEQTPLAWAGGDNRFGRLLEAAPDAMVVVDGDGRIVLINTQTEKVFGYRREEILGQPVEILIPDQFKERHSAHRRVYAEAPHARPMGIGLNLTGRRKNGESFPVEISLSPLEDSAGKLYLSAIRDVTDRKRIENALRQSEEYYRLLVDEVRDYAIFMLDRDGRVVNWNKGAERIHGYSAEEITGQHFSKFHISDEVERGKPEEMLVHAAAGGRWEEEGWRIRKDGSRFWASVTLTAVHGPDGQVVGFAKVVRDITEQKRAREAFVLEITNSLVMNLNAEKLLVAIHSCLKQLKRFDLAELALYDAKADALNVQRLGESTGTSEEETVLPIANTPSGWVFGTCKPLLLQGRREGELPCELPHRLSAVGVKSGCWLPLMGGDEMLGTLNVFSRRAGDFNEEDVQLLGQVASQVGVALRNALTFQRISEIKDRLTEEKMYLEDELRTEFNFEEIIGESAPVKRVLNQIETVAPTDSTVLLLGETGTGKELVARAVHNLSARAKQTFVRVNCASIPAGLLESELFGHEKGAFTGAISQRIGRVELANRGTLFLDEVGDIPSELQPKLLRVLQEMEFERLGNSRTLKTDVRVIAATNRDLRKLVASGEFRSDLFYRLNVFPITVPPLRERKDDIPLLARYFVAKFSSRLKKPIETITPETLEKLVRYSWPGNVRELEHLIERAVILTKGATLRLPSFDTATMEDGSHPTALDDVERAHIVKVLRETNGKIGGPGGAAELLGMNRTTLNSRMQKLGISRKNL